MHRRNLWRTPPDFAALAAKYPELREVALPPSHGGGGVGRDGNTAAPASCRLDWRNSATLPVLSRVLMADAFGVAWECPRTRLCPPLPNRLNYLLWMDDLAASWLPHAGYRRGPSNTAAVDVGTGASAVFPVLGHTSFGWRWVATDIDAESLAAAAVNAAAAAAPGVITTLLVRPDEPPLARAVAAAAAASLAASTASGSGAVPPVACTVCNPPFFATEAEAAASMADYAASACTGAVHEMVTEGGEVAFVQRLIDDSKEAGRAGTVLWFSSMLGKASSRAPLRAALQRAGVPTTRWGALVQGKTRRWVVAWSWRPAAEFLHPGGVAYLVPCDWSAPTPHDSVPVGQGDDDSWDTGGGGGSCCGGGGGGDGGDGDAEEGDGETAGGAAGRRTAAAAAGSKRPREGSTPSCADGGWHACQLVALPAGAAPPPPDDKPTAEAPLMAEAPQTVGGGITPATLLLQAEGDTASCPPPAAHGVDTWDALAVRVAGAVRDAVAVVAHRWVGSGLEIAALPAAAMPPAIRLVDGVGHPHWMTIAGDGGTLYICAGVQRVPTLPAVAAVGVTLVSDPAGLPSGYDAYRQLADALVAAVLQQGRRWRRARAAVAAP